jgi:hypothetical protein
LAGLGVNPGCHGGKPATNCFSYGTAHLSYIVMAIESCINTPDYCIFSIINILYLENCVIQNYIQNIYNLVSFNCEN